MAISALQAAKKVCQIGKWKVTNLQIQKVLYLAHMIYMGRNEGQPLISEAFEAWDYGPVIPSLYHKAKIYGSSPIKELSIELNESGREKEFQALEEACEALLTLSPGALVSFTHREGGAWEKSYKPHVKGLSISNHDILAEYGAIKK